jgi:DNA (cytosine-5)-methyltransferase 1
MEYRVPTMDEVRAVPWNGFNVVSFFSGGGGASLGYRMAGYRVLYANEFIDQARLTYAANKADYTVVDSRDVRTVSAADVLDVTGLKIGELDLMDGSPPCSSFSTSGTREGGWGKVKDYSGRKQRTDDLFFEFARLLDGIQPRTFIAENVSGLVKGTAKGYFLDILAALKACGPGYRVSARVLDAQWLGVPQARPRLIFVGVRNDLGFEPVHPAPRKSWIRLDHILPHIRRVKVGGYANKWEKSDRPNPTLMASDATSSPTAYLSSGGFVELADGSRRKLTIDEVRLVCSFPQDFVLTGDFAQQWERMGRAVPPLMMKSIAETLAERVLLPAEAKRRAA